MQAAWDITLDAKSLLSGAFTGMLAYFEGCSYDGGTVTVFDRAVQKVTFADGFTFEAALEPPTVYTVFEIDAEATKAASDVASALVIVYKDGAVKDAGPDTLFDVSFVFVDTEAENVGKYDGAPEGAWTPDLEGTHKGITFATWSSEAAYLRGEEIS